MRRHYAMVLPTFWTGSTGRKIRALGHEAQVVALYLITSPHASGIGLYHLPLGYVAIDTGTPLEGASKALRSLSEVGFCRYDEDTETVWIPEMARHQVGTTLKPGDNRLGWVAKELDAVRSSPYFHEFLAKYGEAYGLVERSPSEGAPEPPSKPLRSPSEAKNKNKNKNKTMRSEHAHERAHEADPQQQQGSSEPVEPVVDPPTSRPSPTTSSPPTSRAVVDVSGLDDLEAKRLALQRAFQSRFESETQTLWIKPQRGYEPGKVALFIAQASERKGGTFEDGLAHSIETFFSDPWARERNFPWPNFVQQLSRYFPALADERGDV